MQVTRTGEVWASLGVRGDDPLSSALHTYDLPPRSPDPKNLEVITQVPTVTPSGWTVTGNDGSLPSHGSLAGFFENAGPAATNRHNFNDDLRGRWLAYPTTAKSINIWRAFAPTSGTKWCCVAKVGAHASSAVGTDDRVVVQLVKVAPTSSDSDLINDAVAIEWRPQSPDMRSYSSTGGTLGTLTSTDVDSTAVFIRPFYFAFTCETDNSVTVWYSRDGVSWRKQQRYTTGGAIGAVAAFVFSVRDTTTPANILGSLEWVRFLEGDNNPWKLGFGAS